MRRAIATLTLAGALALPAVPASASPARPLSSTGCITLRPGSTNGGVCIHVEGSGAYVAYVLAGNWVPMCCTVSGYYEVRTMYPAAGSFDYTVGGKPNSFSCDPHAVPYRCFPLKVVINKTLGLYPKVPVTSGRYGVTYEAAQEICVYFFSGGTKYGPACELVT